MGNGREPDVANILGKQTYKMSTRIIALAAQMLRDSIEDIAPPPFDNDYDIRIFQRAIEIQAEQCDAIQSLYLEGLFRPAYAVLRSVLEAMATLVWVSTNTERYSKLFETNKQPNMREILKRIEWAEEYGRTFSYLSSFVHIDIDNAEFYREYLIETDPSQPFHEIKSDSEYFLIGTENGPLALAINLMSKEEAQRKYGPYLAAKTYDLIAAGLEKLYGKQLYKKNWWKQEAAALHQKLITTHPDIASKMLWSLQQKLF